jgi:hypothetical protein
MNTPPRHSHTRSLLATVAVAIPAMLIGSGLSAPPAQAGYTVTLTQVGSNVVATGSGTIDTTDLTSEGSGTHAGAISPSTPEIITGPPILTPFSEYAFITGPSSFGSGGFTEATSGSGDLVGIVSQAVDVPLGYTSGSALSDTSTYDDASFSTLGVTPGSYVWTWGSGADADSFTLDVAVPEPASLTLLGTVVGLGLLARRRRKAA